MTSLPAPSRRNGRVSLRYEADSVWRASKGTAPGLLSLLGKGEWELLRGGGDVEDYRVTTPHGDFFVRSLPPTPKVVQMVGLGPDRVVRFGENLRQKGVNTPEPLGFFQSAGGDLLVLQWVDGLTGWREMEFTDARAARTAAIDAGRQVGRLHGMGLGFNWLALHIVFGPPPKSTPYFVGLDATLRLTGRRRLRQLLHLLREADGAASPAARYKRAFFATYLKWAGLERKDALKLLGKLRRKAGKPLK